MRRQDPLLFSMTAMPRSGRPIATAGHQRTMREHTCDSRMRRLAALIDGRTADSRRRIVLRKVENRIVTIYATYFDSDYLVRGLAGLKSVVARSADRPRLLVLALDDACAKTVRRLGPKLGFEHLEIMPLAQLEATYPALATAKSQRSRIEYYFTLTPFLCAEALKRAGSGEHAVYLDADLFFYSDPQTALRAAGKSNVAVVEHRFPPAFAYLADSYGRFNVGWIAFLQSEEARFCVARWQQQCIQWCADHVETGRFADQKYLDSWPQQVVSLSIIDHPGVDVAPWNVAAINWLNMRMAA